MPFGHLDYLNSLFRDEPIHFFREPPSRDRVNSFQAIGRIERMLKEALQIKEVTSKTGSGSLYELYDSDTGTSLGMYASLDKAESEREHMNSSDVAARRGGTDADPGSE